MTLYPSTRHSLIERHLLMAQRCNALAAQLHHSGDAEAAARQRQLLEVFLHNALMQLPLAGAEPVPAAGLPSADGSSHLSERQEMARHYAEPFDKAETAQAGAGPQHWTLSMPGVEPPAPPPGSSLRPQP